MARFTLTASCRWPARAIRSSTRGLVALEDKDLYSRTSPTRDKDLFRKYALNPELAALINALVFKADVAPTTNRTDIAGIFIPDLIKVDCPRPRRVSPAVARQIRSIR
jgi:hypothetical protein